LVAGAVLAAGGFAGLMLPGFGLLAGALVFGLGFGVAQNASVSVMFREVGDGGYNTASAVWNIGYDAGMGLGAAGFGLLAVHTGFPFGFALVAAVIPLSLALLLRRSR
jgi:hypothetical protein